MKVIALLIFATACVAPIAATPYELEPRRSFKPVYLESLNLKGTRTVPCNYCSETTCASHCLNDAACRAFQMKCEPTRCYCVLIFRSNLSGPKELVWVRKEIKDASVNGYVAKSARMCLTNDYKTHMKGVYGSHECAKECNKHADCRGFRLTFDGCEIFRFTICSRNLVLESCNTKDRIWIRNIPGLPAGSLCPNGYEGKYGASSYKIFPVANWYAGAKKCETEKGMVKYADADDKKEDLHIHKLKRSLNKDRSFFIGGIHKAKKYFWETCGHEVSKVMWAPGQPSTQRCCMRISSGVIYGFDDSYADDARYAMCECVNPFE